MQIIHTYRKACASLEQAKWLPLLLLRSVLAYGFYEPAKTKLTGIADVANWFATMNIPFPLLNAYLAGITEALGVVLLALGLGTRIITVPLMITMLVAIFIVHWSNGFASSDNGFEIPLYYLLMLLVLFVLGPGKVSLDGLLFKQKKQA